MSAYCPATGNTTALIQVDKAAEPLGSWRSDTNPAPANPEALLKAIRQINSPLYLVLQDDQLALGQDGVAVIGSEPAKDNALPLVGYSEACPLESLGSAAFCRDHGLKYAFLAGSMANGIASVELVEAMARQGMLGFFGSAGLTLEEVEGAIDRIQKSLDGGPYGFNLIHSPNEPDLEAAVVDLYLRRGVRLVEASAYLDLTLPVVRYRVHDIHLGPDGELETPNRLIAKVSRVEVAGKFMSPPPEGMLRELVSRKDITEEQAELAARIPMAQDITAEADSAGHTDNRPAITLLPTMLALRDRMQAEHGFQDELRVGMGGGISTPASAAGAFAMGAAYILTGSVNQACIEAGTSDYVRGMLAQAEQADIIMAPAADMFEMGVKLQVLKRGTMFAMRAAKLYELYNAYSSLEEIPAAERDKLERTVFHAPLDDIWRQACDYFRPRDPSQISRGEKNPKHKMALIFRWYLGLSSLWANRGDPSRKIDYQVWCGPAMGAFNEWVKGSFLEKPEHRSVGVVSLNILLGAAMIIRLNGLRRQGVQLAAGALRIEPLELESIGEYLD